MFFIIRKVKKKMNCTPEEAVNHKCCSIEKNCEGSKCMAWEWVYVPDPMLKNTPGIQLKFVQSDRGFCGLANKSR